MKSLFAICLLSACLISVGVNANTGKLGAKTIPNLFKHYGLR